MKRVMSLILALVAAMALSVTPALAQGSGSLAQYSEGLASDFPTVTFELTVDGEVPEGSLLGVSVGIADAPEPVFCSTANFDTDLPRCEDGGTYTDTFDLVPAGGAISYEYYVMNYDYGIVTETFAGDTVTASEGQTISATYEAGSNPGGERITLTGIVERPEATTYQYGTHAITDVTQNYYALQSASVDLDAHVGRSVTVFGTLVPGYESGQVEDGPPLVEVTRVVPTEEPDDYKVTLDFELATEGPPPSGTSFFGFIPAEGGISTQLTDPDGDGLYTGSMEVPQYAPGPRPVHEGTEPVTLPVQIVMSSEVKHGSPLYPDVIEDFGQVLMDEDKLFSDSTVFEGPEKPVEPGTPSPEPDGEDSPGPIEQLPDTGGVTLMLLGVISLLISAGLLFTGLLSKGALRRRSS